MGRIHRASQTPKSGPRPQIKVRIKAHATDKQGVDNTAREFEEAGQLVGSASPLPQWLTFGAGTFSAIRRWSVSSACVTVLRRHPYLTAVARIASRV